MTEKATKRPWKVAPDKDRRSLLYRILSKYDEEIAWVNNEANADLIVRAVNEYDKLKADNDALVAALDDLQKQANSMNNYQHAGISVTADDWAELYRFCYISRAALEAARGSN
jgi:hypothetical protein